jgi:hypothetical protein
MPLQFSTALRNSQAGQLEVAVGTGPIFQIRTGSPPVSCAAADTGTLLAELTLPTDWLSAPNDGAVAKIGTWQVEAIATGTAGHFRLKNSSGTVTHVQGVVTITGGGGDVEVNNTSIAVTQTVTISSFTYTRGNA